MDNEFLMDLVYNAALLLVLVFVFNQFYSKLRVVSIWRQIWAGFFLGIIGIAIIETHWEYVSGVIFDTRTMLMGVTGLFFGGLPTIVALMIILSYRIYLGGTGVIMGVATILESAVVGLLWRRMRLHKLSEMSAGELYLFGLTIHGIMLLATWLLPSDIRVGVLSNIWMPVIVVYPIITMFLAMFLNSGLILEKISKELIEKEQTARAILDLTFEFIGLLSPEGILLDVNKTALDFEGVASAEVIGKPFWETPWWSFSKATQAQIKEAIKKAAAGKMVRDTTTHKNKDGKLRTIDFTVKPVFNEAGKIIYLIPEGRDITETKLAEEALKQSEYFFKESQRAAYIGSYQADFVKGLWESSEVLDEIFGIDRNYVRSIQGWLDLVAPEDKEMMGRYLQDEIMTKHQPFNKEYRILRPSDGRKKWVLGLGRVGLDGEGKAVSLMGTIQDITRKKEDEMKLFLLNQKIFSDKQRMEAILRDMGDAVFVTDNKKEIIMVNRAMENLWGMSQREMVRKSVEEITNLYYESSGKKPVDLIEEVFVRKKQAVPKESLVLHHKSGDKLYLDGIGSPIMDVNKTLVGTVWVFRDVTKQRETDKMKTDFISLASHQLRTPLTGIKWFVEILQEAGESISGEKRFDYIRKIGESNERMITLVNDLIGTSKAESGKLGKEIGKISVKELVQRAIDEQGRLFLNKKIKILGMDLIPEALELEVDTIQMAQVLGNLLNNAASYSGVGSKIEIKVLTTNKTVTIAVKDEGVGIPVNQQAKMFDKFFRADNVAKTIPGSGLGLYVAKSMVENHGGKIWFESGENEGTTFFVKLPRKKYRV